MALANSAVKVCVRVRPLSYSEEMEAGHAASNEACIFFTGPNTLLIGKDHIFTFDAIFGPDVSQEAVYKSTAVALIDKFMQGYHATIFAYGQTGSGKTFTMGTGLDGSMEGANLGIVPRAIEDMFGRLSQAYPHYDPSKDTRSVVREAASSQGSSPYQLYVSFLEVYNEEIKDLLSSHQSHEPRPRLVLREDASGEIYLAGCAEERIYSPSELFSVLRKGTLCRTTASTEMNLTSSRSHAIFTLTLRQQASEPEGSGGAGPGANLVSKFHFVDLAGSERLKRTHAVGHRVKEAISINSGLLALGNVINALSDTAKSRSHVPYRDSKLTRLLQSSLGGNSTTVMMACVSPSESNFSESLNTLKYAGRARAITNRVTVNVDSGGSLFEIAQLKKQVMHLKQELLLLKNGSSHHDVSSQGYGRGGSEALGKELKEKFEKAIQALTLENSQLKVRLKASQAFVEHRSIDEAALSPLVVELATLKSKAAVSDILFSRGTALGSHVTAEPLPIQGAPSTEPLVSRIRSELASHISVLHMQPLCSSRHAFAQGDEPLGHEMTDEEEDLEGEAGSGRHRLDRLQLERMLASIQAELTSKAELLHAYEQQKSENALMKTKYEEQLGFLQESVTLLKREKLSDSSTKRDSMPQLAKISRDKYEAKIQKLTKELATLRERYQDALQQSKAIKSSTPSVEPVMEGLKTTISCLKTEKNRLITTMTEEMNKLRTLLEMRDAEIKELRLLQKSAVEEAKMYKKSLDYQKSMIKKKSTIVAAKRGAVGFKSPPRTGSTLTTVSRRAVRHPAMAAQASLTSSRNLKAISEGLRDGFLPLSPSAAPSTDQLGQLAHCHEEQPSRTSLQGTLAVEPGNAALDAKSQLRTTHFPRPQLLATPSVGSTPASASRAVRKNAWILTRNDVLRGSSPIVGLVSSRSGPTGSSHCASSSSSSPSPSQSLFSKEGEDQADGGSDLYTMPSEDGSLPAKSLLGR